MRKKSSIDNAKRKDRIERARRMTPEERLLACVHLARMTFELQQAGERHREAALHRRHS